MIYLTEEQIDMLKAQEEKLAINFKGKPEQYGFETIERDFKERPQIMKCNFQNLTGLYVYYNKILNLYEIFDYGHVSISKNPTEEEIKKYQEEVMNCSYGVAWGESFIEAYENLLYKKEGMYCTLKDFRQEQDKRIRKAVKEMGWIDVGEDNWVDPNDPLTKEYYKFTKDGKLVKKESIDYLRDKLNL